MYVQINTWWSTTTAALAAQRRNLAGRALGALCDLPLQALAVAGLERVQQRYLVCATAVYVLCVTSVLAPEQLAEIWVTCWPHMAGGSGGRALACPRLCPQGANPERGGCRWLERATWMQPPLSAP